MIKTIFALALLATPALAKGTPPPAQNHHCKLADGSMDMKKTHKECDTAKGTWAKDAAATTDKPAAPATPATPPKAADAPKTAPAPTK
jgi:hypothetical protein